MTKKKKKRSSAASNGSRISKTSAPKDHEAKHTGARCRLRIRRIQT